MKFSIALLIFGVATFLVAGCNESDTNFPAGKSGWQMTLDLGEYPAGDIEYPVVMNIEAHVKSLDSGANAPDGSLLVFLVSDGTFENGLSEIEKTTLNGKATTTFQANHPGTYEMTVDFEGQSTPFVSTFTLGQ